jgi:serine/threonine-protein kinase Chk1
MPFVHEGLTSLGVTCREAPPDAGALRLRIGGQDARKEVFRGWVEVEPFEYRGSHGSFCVMQKDNVRETSISLSSHAY